MANTSQFLTTFLQEAMGAFTSILLPITALSFAVSPEACHPGDVVKVPFAQNVSGSATFDYSTGFLGDSNMIGVKTVTVDKLVYQKFSITDADSAKLAPQAIAQAGP